MKATYLPTEGYAYTSQSTGTAKILNSGAGSNRFGHDPPITLNQGNTVSLHLINEDSETHSKHNINIDEFDVSFKRFRIFSKPNNYIYNK